MNVFVRIVDTDTIVMLNIEHNDTVVRVIQMLQKKENLPQKQYILYLDGRVLDKSKTLVEYNVPRDQMEYVSNVSELLKLPGLVQFYFMRHRLLYLCEPNYTLF